MRSPKVGGFCSSCGYCSLGGGSAIPGIQNTHILAEKRSERARAPYYSFSRQRPWPLCNHTQEMNFKIASLGAFTPFVHRQQSALTLPSRNHTHTAASTEIASYFTLL